MVVQKRNLVFILLFIFIYWQPVSAKSEKEKAMKVIKQIKRDRARIAKYKKKDDSLREMAVRKNKIKLQEAQLQSVYSDQYAKEAEKRIKRVAMELSKSKTVRDWVNKTAKKNRLNRRMHFSKYMNHKLPKFYKGKYSIHLYSENEKRGGLTVTLFPSKSGLQYIVNNRNLTRKKRESFSTWQKRVGAILRKKQNALLELLIPTAHAFDFNSDSLYINMMGLSLNDGWEDQTYREQNYGSEEFEMLVNDAVIQRDFFGLRCESNRSARFNANLGGQEVPVQVAPQRNQSGMLEMTFANPQNPNQAAGTLHVRSDGRHSYITVPDSERKYPSEAIPGTMNALVNGQPIPTINHGIFDGSGARPDAGDVVSSVANLRACAAAHAAGITPSCDVNSSPSEYRSCMAENYMQSDLAAEGFSIGGLFGGGPSGGLSEMDRMAAVNAKLQLLESYARYPTDMISTGGYPGPNHYVTVSPYGPGTDTVRAILAQGQGDELYHSQVIDCFESSLQSKPCSGDQLPQEVRDRINHFATPLRRNGTFPDQVPPSQLQAEARQLLESAPEACRGLMPEERQRGLEDYVTLEQQQTSGARDLVPDLDQMTAGADVGLACCGNAQCREALNGVDRGGTFSLGTATSQ